MVKNDSNDNTNDNDNIIYYEIDEFLTNKECDEILNKKHMFETSQVIDSNPTTKDRTSTQVWLDKYEYSDLNNKLLNLANQYSNYKVDINKSEDIQLVQYFPGQQYKAHYDQCNLEEESCKEDFTVWKSLRYMTVLVYLNDDFEGGETEFPNLNIKIKPKKGKALIFFNIKINNESLSSSERLENSLHSGLPVKSGKKYIINKWFRV